MKFTILDVSKTLMYELNFDYMKKKYPGKKSKLIFTDTNLQIYVIKIEDTYDDRFSEKEIYDFSQSDKDSKYYDTENMKKTWENEGQNRGAGNSGICRFKNENVFNINKKGKGSEKSERS